MEIEERVLEVGIYTVENKSTIRDTAKVFHVSRGTVFDDLTKRLPRLDKDLAMSARIVLDENKAIRAYRGNEAMNRNRGMKNESVNE